MTDIMFDDFLEHYGVKGMKWGVRKAERRARQDDKANSIINMALKEKDNVLITLNGRIVVTGKEFIDHMGNDGLMNIKTTNIYATKGGDVDKEAVRINSLKV